MPSTMKFTPDWMIATHWLFCGSGIHWAWTGTSPRGKTRKRRVPGGRGVPTTGAAGCPPMVASPAAACERRGFGVVGEVEEVEEIEEVAEVEGMGEYWVCSTPARRTTSAPAAGLRRSMPR